MTPDPAGAGSSRIFTGAPLCKPIPHNSITEPMVCSKCPGSTDRDFLCEGIFQNHRLQIHYKVAVWQKSHRPITSGMSLGAQVTSSTYWSKRKQKTIATKNL